MVSGLFCQQAGITRDKETKTQRNNGETMWISGWTNCGKNKKLWKIHKVTPKEFFLSPLLSREGEHLWKSHLL